MSEAITPETKINSQEKMKTYSYATDSSSGSVEAATLDAAYDSLRAKISDEMLSDGATLWVAEEDGSDRLTMGVDRD